MLCHDNWTSRCATEAFSTTCAVRTVVRVCGGLVAIARWQSMACTESLSPGFDSQQLPAFHFSVFWPINI